MATTVPRQRIEGEGISYRMLGMIPEGYDYLSKISQLYASTAAAVYDPASKAVLIGDFLEPDEITETIVHELVHALQYQQFPLSIFKDQTLTSDELMARYALIEGDALVIEELAQGARQYGEVKRKVLLSLRAKPTPAPQPNKLGAEETIPDSLRTLLEFSSEYGKQFVLQLRKRGGNRAVDQAFGVPPACTAEILNPQSYFAGSSLEHELLSPQVFPEKSDIRLRVVFSDRLGEYAVRVLLSNWLGEARSVEAARGWSNDRLTLFAGMPQGLLLVWESEWANAAEAREFREAIGDTLRLRGKLLRPGHFQISEQAGEAQVRQRGSCVRLIIGNKEILSSDRLNAEPRCARMRRVKSSEREKARNAQ